MISTPSLQSSQTSSWHPTHSSISLVFMLPTPSLRVSLHQAAQNSEVFYLENTKPEKNRAVLICITEFEQLNLFLWCFPQAGDRRINTTTCGCLWWEPCSAVLLCLSSTGGQLCSHMALKFCSTFTSQSRSRVSLFVSLEMLQGLLNIKRTNHWWI